MPKMSFICWRRTVIRWITLLISSAIRRICDIMANIAKQLNLPDEKFLHNIEELGNTGSVSSALVYAQNDKNFKKDDLIAITVFGGGYSTGACLIKH